jgi:hypothetical protein
MRPVIPKDATPGEALVINSAGRGKRTNDLGEPCTRIAYPSTQIGMYMRYQERLADTHCLDCLDKPIEVVERQSRGEFEKVMAEIEKLENKGYSILALGKVRNCRIPSFTEKAISTLRAITSLINRKSE